MAGLQLPAGPSVLTSTPRGPRQSGAVATGGESLAGALNTAANEAGNAADMLIERDAQTQAWQAQDELTREFATWNAEARRARQGANAKGYAQEVDAWWKKAAEKAGGKLSPLAQRYASRGLSAAQISALQGATSYEEQQLEIGAVSAFRSSQATMTQSAIEAGPVAGAVIVEAAKRQAREFAASRGLDAEAEVLKLTTHTYANMVQALAMQRPDLASQFFQEKKGEIDAARHAEIEKVLKAETDNMEARRFAASVASLPLDQQLAKAADIQDPERRDKTLQSIKTNYALVEAARKANEGQAADDAWQLVAQGKRPPEALLGRMDGKERIQLQEHLRTRADRLAAGRTVKTDWTLYNTLRERIRGGEKVRLQAYTEHIAGAQLEQLNDMLDKQAKPEKQLEAVTQEQQLSSFVQENGLKGEKAGQFKSAAQQMYAEHLQRTGKEPTYEERLAIHDRLWTDAVVKKGWLWDTTEKPYRLPREERAKVLGVQPGTAANPVKVNSPAEAAALPTGAHYITPDGRLMVRK